MICLTYDPGDFLWLTSPDIFWVEEFDFHILQLSNFGCYSPLFIVVNKQTTLNRLTANCITVGNPCNLQLDTVGFILTRTCKSAIVHSVLTRSLLYIPQNFPLVFIIIFISFSTWGNYRSTNTSAKCEHIRCKPINRYFVQCAFCWNVAPMQTPVSPPLYCQCSLWRYNPGQTCENGQYSQTQWELEAACDGMWGNLYWDRWWTTNFIMYHWYT